MDSLLFCFLYCMIIYTRRFRDIDMWYVHE